MKLQEPFNRPNDNRESFTLVDDGNKTDFTHITPNATNEYDTVIKFNFSGRRNLDDVSTEHYNHLLIAKIDGLWRLVIPGMSPNINEK